MPAEDKIIAPRIVQPRPWRTVTLLILVLAAVGAAGYAGYQFGLRQQAGTLFGPPGPDVEELEARIEEQEEERDELQTGLRALPPPDLTETPPEAGLPEETPQLPAPQAELPEEAPQPPAPPPSPSPDPAEQVDGARPDPTSQPAVTADDDAPETAVDGALDIEEFQLKRSDSPNTARFSFAVGHVNGGSASVVGSIWIAVNGSSGGKPIRLSLRNASNEKSDYVRMRFKQRQFIEGEFRLPDDFVPANVIVEAKPLDEEKFRPAARTFDWNLPGG